MNEPTVDEEYVAAVEAQRDDLMREVERLEAEVESVTDHVLAEQRLVDDLRARVVELETALRALVAAEDAFNATADRMTDARTADAWRQAHIDRNAALAAARRVLEGRS